MGDWHCKQIPNGQQPIVVCERETLTAEIKRLRAAGDRLAAAVNAVACFGTRDEMTELTDAFLDWEAGRV